MYGAAHPFILMISSNNVARLKDLPSAFDKVFQQVFRAFQSFVTCIIESEVYCGITWKESDTASELFQQVISHIETNTLVAEQYSATLRPSSKRNHVETYSGHTKV